MTTYAWNKDKTISVNIDKLRRITITWIAPYTFEVKGWFTNREAVPLGTFETHEKAQSFIQKMQPAAHKRTLLERALNIHPQKPRQSVRLVWK